MAAPRVGERPLWDGPTCGESKAGRSVFVAERLEAPKLAEMSLEQRKWGIGAHLEDPGAGCRKPLKAFVMQLESLVVSGTFPLTEENQNSCLGLLIMFMMYNRVEKT